MLHSMRTAEPMSVTLGYISDNIAEMARAGVAARLQTVSDFDHFLVFSHRALAIDSLAAWLQEDSGGM